MTIFDLLFLAAALTAVASVVVIVVARLRGRRDRARTVARRLGIGVVCYLAAGVAVSWLRPHRLIEIGTPWCFDDWCLAADRVVHATVDGRERYDVDLRIFSTAGRPQRALGAWLYLVDPSGRRFDPAPAPDAVPLDAWIGARETVRTARRFDLPAGTVPVGLITGHGGRYCGWQALLIIGDGSCLFGRPPMIVLPRG